MYAVVEIGGHQYKVAENDILFINRRPEEVDSEINIDRVLLVNDGEGNISVGQPVVDGASVTAKVIEHAQDDKVVIFKKKRRKGYRVKRGHRQPLTQLQIEKINTN